jgi:hypothetical protein
MSEYEQFKKQLDSLLPKEIEFVTKPMMKQLFYSWVDAGMFSDKGKEYIKKYLK